MTGSKSSRLLMRIYVEEQDKVAGGHKPLYEAIVYLLHKRGYAGATVVQGIMGFGAGAQVHRTRALALRDDVPVVIEVVETALRVAEIIPELDAMIGSGLITLEAVTAV